MTELVSLVIAMILVAMCGVFVAAEFAFMTVNRAAVESAAERGDRGAQGLLEGLRTLSTQLSGAQLGITVTNLLIGYLSEPSIASLISPALQERGMSEAAVSATAMTIGLLLATGITMIFGELVPKNLAIAKPLAVGRFVLVQGFQRLWTRCLIWPIRLFNNNANWLVSRMGFEPKEELATARSIQELAALVRHSARKGTLTAHSAELVEKMLAFGDRRARDVMPPRSEIAMLEPDSSVEQLVLMAQQTGHSRFPVIEIVTEGAHKRPVALGIAHVRRALEVPFADRSAQPVSTIMSEPLFVPDSVMLDDLMDQLRETGMQMALLVDEFGSLAGLVTFEDLVEELVGEVQDEHDPHEQAPAQDLHGRWVLPGRLSVHDASQALGVMLPDGGDYSTVGGLITAQLGRFAETGDQVVISTANDDGPGPDLVLQVLETQGRHIETVLVAEADDMSTDGELR